MGVLTNTFSIYRGVLVSYESRQAVKFYEGSRQMGARASSPSSGDSMKVLVACEFSQVVTKAFRNKGYEAYSCDLLATEGNLDWHIQDDVLKHLEDGWDLMIAHPPCTHLSVSGARWFTEGKKPLALRQRAYEFVMSLYNAPVDKICIENPVGLLSTLWRKPNQVIEPYMFGHPETKRTCLWLKNLPLLRYGESPQLAFNDKILPVMKYVKKEMDLLPPKEKHRIWWMGSGHGKERSITYEGVAQAMAEQWGDIDG